MKMIELTRTDRNTRLKRELSREAIALALKGDWERAAELNRAILELHPDDVDAMNRLGKALLESAQYQEAEVIFNRVIALSPYNNITKKNLARLRQLATAPATSKQVRKLTGAPELFIEESGKSATTLLSRPAGWSAVALIAPGDPVNLSVEKNTITVKTREGEYLGQIEPKMGARLIRLLNGGNRYEAAIIGVKDQATGSPSISVIIRETLRHPSLKGVSSFPTKGKDDRLAYLGDSLLQYVEDDELDDEERDELVGVESEGSDSDSEEWKE